jgi:hypothetical protein
VTADGEVIYIVRDAEQGSRAAIYTTKHIGSGKWKMHTLTDFSLDAWEPTIDTELWKQHHQLNIFVQTTHQGDGEKTVEAQPSTVYVLEMEPEAQRMEGCEERRQEQLANDLRRERCEICRPCPQDQQREEGFLGER